MKISRKLSEQALNITEPEDVVAWLRAVDKWWFRPIVIARSGRS